MRAKERGSLRRRETASRRLVALAVAAIALVAVVGTARADAPDVKVPPQTPVITGTAVTNANGTVTVTVKGAWAWPTHGKDCNTDRAGAGVAIDWFDPSQPGNDLGAKVPIGGVQTEIAVGTAAANQYNPADNVVHPTENDTGSAAVVDVTDPSQYKNWRGGCGVYSDTKDITGQTKTMSHGNFGRVKPGDKDALGNPFNDPTPPSSSSLQGAALQHTYAKSSDVSRVCAVTYDVHPGTKASDNNGAGIPGGDKEITAGGAGHNGDNGVEKNQNTPLGNACVAFTFAPPHPDISILKSPKSQTIQKGGTAQFSITVTNTGNVTLTNVHVTDAQSPDCNRTIGTMDPGATFTYTCSKAHVDADFTNVAIATGTPPSGQDVTDQDTADVHVLAPGAAGIDIVKSPKSQQVASGGTATFTITVTNIGAVTLTNVHVTDAASPNCNRTIGTMAAGATVSYTCTRPNVTSAFTNVAVATGTPPNGPDVTDSDTANVSVLAPGSPAISIVKNPKSQTVAHGGTATFTITVTNTGAVTLTDVTVSDPLSPNCDRNIGTLTPGQSVSYTCTRANVTADFTNVATSTGTPPSGPPVSATDTAPVKAAPLVPPKKKPVKKPVHKKKPKVVSHLKPKATG